MKDGSGQSSPSQVDVPKLRSLGPAYDPALHRRHAEVLLQVLTDESKNAAKNIALAGHYGSGKSSVILGVEDGLDKRRIPWVNLSLPSLGLERSDAVSSREGVAPTPLTNAIQKEIVKQLLYRKAPKHMPGSRYFRIDSFRWGSALGWSLVAAVGSFVMAVMLGLVARVESMWPPLGTPQPLASWLTVVTISLFFGTVSFMTLRMLHNRVRVESVSAGGAAVKLSAKENSYFDEYLDEIVYFFQRTNTQVALFEDLDRFKDPHIFETLRELNTVLNNSEQITARPVRFVYAVRDSIFESLGGDDQTKGSPEAGNTSAADLESIPSANRTKFFDMVIPMVPFITHRSIRDLLADEFDDCPYRPSRELVDTVGSDRELTDMRVLRNIRNEFEIYRASILGEKGLQELDPDRLVAMMIYKNTHLEDFEAIRLGTSQIDAAYRAFRQLVEAQVGHQLERSKVALAQAKEGAEWERQAEMLGKRLQQVLPIVLKATGRAGDFVMTVASKNYSSEDLVEPNLWRALVDAPDTVQLTTPGYSAMHMTSTDLLLLAKTEATLLKAAITRDTEELKRRSRAALKTKDFVAKATIAELIARTDLKMPSGEHEGESLSDIVATLVSPLAFELLSRGFIDENYTLYCSDYHDVAISIAAMNFILHCVQPDISDPIYELDNASIESVRIEEGGRFLGGESVLNVAVFDHYLAEQPGLLDDALSRLVVRADGGDTTFLDLYLEAGTIGGTTTMIERLAAIWSDLFDHLVRVSGDSRLLDVAIRHASPQIEYIGSDSLRQFIAEHFREMGAFTAPMSDEEAGQLVSLLRRLGATIPILADVSETQRRALIAQDLYPVTRENLTAATGADLSLDVIKQQNKGVYLHTIGNLPAYLAALDESEPTIREPANFEAAIDGIAGAPDAEVEEVARRAATGCELRELSKVDPSAWGPTVAADRVRTTASNVRSFIEHNGVTSELARALDLHGIVETNQLDEDERTALAYQFVRSPLLSPLSRVSLLGQLELPNYLDPAEFDAEGLTILPDLLAANEVADTAVAYSFVADQPFASRERFFAVSTKLASYVTQLTLSADDLPLIMRSPQIAPQVKRAIADDAEFIESLASSEGAQAICEWATGSNDLAPDVVAVLSRAGAPVDHVIRLLQPHLPNMATQDLSEVLRALGSQYEGLTRKGAHQPKLPTLPGTSELLDDLHRRGLVSTYNEKRAGTISVYMHR